MYNIKPVGQQWRIITCRQELERNLSLSDTLQWMRFESAAFCLRVLPIPSESHPLAGWDVWVQKLRLGEESEVKTEMVEQRSQENRSPKFCIQSPPKSLAGHWTSCTRKILRFQKTQQPEAEWSRGFSCCLHREESVWNLSTIKLAVF